MKRKDCESPKKRRSHARASDARSPARALTLLSALVWAGAPALLRAGSVHLWPTGVVTEDVIYLGAVAELRGFDIQTEQTLRQIVVTSSPPAGGSKFVHLDGIRAALTAHGTNMAEVTLGGPVECAVTRPAALPAAAGVPATLQAANEAAGRGTSPQEANLTSSNAPTLRKAVIDYFNTELREYGGQAELLFDRTPSQVLELSGPAYSFAVHRRSKEVLGLVSLDVDVTQNGKTLQTLPLVVQVALLRNLVVARRPINQGATIRPADVEIETLTFNRLDSRGFGDPAEVIGQRAKRFIAVDSVLQADMLESVPLVLRGQMVTLIACVGDVNVVTSGKALQNGQRGAIVKVRAAEPGDEEFEAVVTGPGRLEVGPASAGRTTRLAQGGP